MRNIFQTIMQCTLYSVSKQNTDTAHLCWSLQRRENQRDLHASRNPDERETRSRHADTNGAINLQLQKEKWNECVCNTHDARNQRTHSLTYVDTRDILITFVLNRTHASRVCRALPRSPRELFRLFSISHGFTNRLNRGEPNRQSFNPVEKFSFFFFEYCHRVSGRGWMQGDTSETLKRHFLTLTRFRMTFLFDGNLGWPFGLWCNLSWHPIDSIRYKMTFRLSVRTTGTIMVQKETRDLCNTL